MLLYERGHGQTCKLRDESSWIYLYMEYIRAISPFAIHLRVPYGSASVRLYNRDLRPLCESQEPQLHPNLLWSLSVFPSQVPLPL